MFIPFIIAGVVFISFGIYVLLTKNIFGKRDPWPAIVKALNLSENAVKRISIAFGIFFILMGSNFFINGVRSPEILSIFWFLNID